MRRTLATGLLLSSMFLTAAAYASDDVSASTPRVSTGVTPPQVLNSIRLAPDQMIGHTHPADSIISVSFMVDEKGQPRDIQVLKGSDPYWNSLVTSAVQNLRYRPATLNNRPVAMAVKLNINIE